ncbi:MAG TPA: hypothetical protein GX745_01700 [Clostridiales bacterium]|nr:hypothetical protein [Clostridiales bacterium]
MKDLLIDIGSTNIKWAINDANDLKVSKTKFPSQKPLPPPYFEVELKKIIDIIINIIKSQKDIKNIFISTQMHGYVLADQDKNPVTDYISWQDERGSLINYPYEVPKEYGVDLKPNLPRVSVFALKNQKPDIYQKAHEFFTLGSYIAYYFTQNNATHITDGAPSGFFNIVTRQAHKTKLSLPKISYDVEIIGQYKGINVYSPVGDQQAAILGCLAPDDAYILNLGTAGQLCAINDVFIKGDFEPRPYFYNKILCTVTRLMGGKAIQNYQGDNLALQLTNNYLTAIKKLPPRSKIIATGGVINYQKDLITQVLDNIGLPYILNQNTDALNGLKILASGEH